jgi:hypothetical protein
LYLAAARFKDGEDGAYEHRVVVGPGRGLHYFTRIKSDMMASEGSFSSQIHSERTIIELKHVQNSAGSFSRNTIVRLVVLTDDVWTIVVH